MPRPKRPSELARERVRSLQRDELVFFRSYLLGGDAAKLAHNLLAPGVEPRQALRYIRDQVVMAAHRDRRFAVARLMRLNLSDKPVPVGEGSEPPLVPSLEEYRKSIDPTGGFYTEAELLELYLKAYPLATKIERRAQRNRRLRERQADAVAQIEPLVVADPTIDDPIAAWFAPALAATLEAAGLLTLADLADVIDERGFRWWTQVPRIGAKRAAEIVYWLQRNDESLGRPVATRALVPRRALDVSIANTQLGRETTIVPLERFAPSGGLSGEKGRFRAPPEHNLVGVSNDYAAVQTWIAARGSSPHTKRSYRKEAERLLLWAILEQQTALSSLTVDDCRQYRDWLAALGRCPEEVWQWRLPQSEWIGPRNAERLSPVWRPFDGPLSESSQRQARVILQALFQWLTEQRYLIGNPWKGVGRDAPPPAGQQDDEGSEALIDLPVAQLDIRGRSLTTAQWQAVVDHIDACPADLAQARLRLILILAYGTGLRAAELVSAVTGALRRYTDRQGHPYDMLLVRGKGRRIRSVPMPTPVMAALSEYLMQRGLGEDPYACEKETRLLAPLDIESARAMSTSWLYKLLRDLFAQVAQHLATEGRNADARKLEVASTHWIRHTFGSHAVERGIPLNVVQQNLGHASLNTTTIYTTQEVETRFAELERFMKRDGQCTDGH